MLLSNLAGSLQENKVFHPHGYLLTSLGQINQGDSNTPKVYKPTEGQMSKSRVDNTLFFSIRKK